MWLRRMLIVSEYLVFLLCAKTKKRTKFTPNFTKQKKNMPRSAKHLRGEVKPSKFKTSMCQYYTKGETCPFGDKCAFAHGDTELRSEQQNLVELCIMDSSNTSSSKISDEHASLTQHNNESILNFTTCATSCSAPTTGRQVTPLEDSLVASSCEVTTPRDVDVVTPPAPSITPPLVVVFRHNPYSPNGRTMASSSSSGFFGRVACLQ